MAFQVTEVQRVLKGADYPMDGPSLADLAKRNGAADELVDALRGLGQVDGPNGVMKQLKGELGGATPGGRASEEKEYKDVEGPAFQVNEVQKYLKGADYPADGKALAALAKKNGAGEDLVGALSGLGESDGPNGVMKQFKGELGGSTPGGIDAEQRQYKDVEGPAFQVNEVQKYLKGADYPMDGKALAALAEKNGAGDDLVGALKGLKQADGPNGVMKQLKDHLGGKPAD